MDPAFPPGAARDVDPVAAAVIDDALKLRASHPAAPSLDILDLVLQGRRARPISFGAVSPVSPFGLLVVEAFDRGMPVSDSIGFYRYPDPRVIAALDDIWRKEVWPALTTRFFIA
ncbi:MAG: hypothetical protein IH627_00580 [Rubrivivax sp.]|nr:hypothetical protein [Rubrivivax sp.]